MIKINGIEVDKSVLNPMFTDEELDELMNEDTFIELTADENVGDVVYIGGNKTLAANGSPFAYQDFTPEDFENVMAHLKYPDSNKDYTGGHHSSGEAQMIMFADIIKAICPDAEEEMDEFLNKLGINDQDNEK